ncbi:hypothetical protein L1987_04380 [Smallanthus sonchifolius]|uniref:Uncharacterized protein n=1 Tax=Smallanthus sonchifolius TaxID=185202 RepID=A0ACB9KDG0_9ASTR|nr:hypothetical protein L1987_04380 [Smallanthus sonchifolius]
MAYVDHAFSISDEDIMMESDSVYTEDEKSDGESDNVVLTVDLTLMQARLHAYTALSLKRSIEWIAASDLEDESAKLKFIQRQGLGDFKDCKQFKGLYRNCFG